MYIVKERGRRGMNELVVVGARSNRKVCHGGDSEDAPMCRGTVGLPSAQQTRLNQWKTLALTRISPVPTGSAGWSLCEKNPFRTKLTVMEI